MRRRRGFTLVELAFVLAVLSILVGISVPGYQQVLRYARTSEARSMVQALHHAELVYQRDHGAALECLAPAAEPIPLTAVPFAARPCWKALGFKIEGVVRYRYQVKQTAAGFDVIAEGDLDGDAVHSTFTLSSQTLKLTTENELE